MTDTARMIHSFAGEMAIAQPAGKPHHYTSAGGDYALPIEYRGVRTLLVTFPVPLALLGELLPPGIEPRRLYGSDGGLVLQFVDAPDTSIGPYNESILSVIVEDAYRWPSCEEPVDWEPPVCYAVWLGVSTPLALYSGQAIWGFPKTLAETRCSANHERVSATVVQDGRTIISCEGTRSLDGERGVVRMRSLTHLRGELCRASVHGHCSFAVAVPGECRLTFHPGSKISSKLSQLLAPASLDAPFSVHYLWNHDYRLTAPI